MSLQNEKPLYPRDPYDEYEMIRHEQATIAQILGTHWRLDASADVSYWQRRLIDLAQWINTLGDLIDAAGERAQERMAERRRVAGD